MGIPDAVLGHTCCTLSSAIEAKKATTPGILIKTMKALALHIRVVK